MKQYRQFIIKIVVLTLSCIIFLLTCSKSSKEAEIYLPSTPVLTGGSLWGVVKSNYVRIRSEPSMDSEVIGGFTKGTVVEILFATTKEETLENVKASWYKVNFEGGNGWLFGGFLEIVDSKAKAEAISREFK
jgi:uncharacterized protein YgiM (DUF1202 family)